MPHLFRTCDGIERKPGPSIPLQLADGSWTDAVWAGSATEEKLGWWLSKSGNQIAQSEPVAAVASKADNNGEIIWGDAPNEARLIFVLEASPPGKNYRLAKMVTVAATPSQIAHFRHERSALFGTLQPDGNIKRIPPESATSPTSSQNIRHREAAMMDRQFTLFQSPEPVPNRCRLFLGIFPDAAAVDLICEQQTHMCNKFGLRGKPRPRGHLHITLHHIGDYPDVSEPVVAATAKVCARVVTIQPSFEVTFDHVKSFRGRPDNLPFVLVNPNGNAALMELHRPLVTELAKQRLATQANLKFVPHVTMLYDEHSVPEQPVRPVRWTVKEVVLVLSHLGATKYDRLERWPLAGD